MRRTLKTKIGFETVRKALIYNLKWGGGLRDIAPNDVKHQALAGICFATSRHPNQVDTSSSNWTATSR
jgi:hypothetical protein